MVLGNNSEHIYMSRVG